MERLLSSAHGVAVAGGVSGIRCPRIICSAAFISAAANAEAGSARRAVRSGVLRGRFDVLLLLARMLGVPLIASTRWRSARRYVGKAAKWWTIPRADALIVSSRAEADMLARRYGVLQDRMRLVLTPIETNAFRPMNRLDACRIAGLNTVAAVAAVCRPTR